MNILEATVCGCARYPLPYACEHALDAIYCLELPKWEGRKLMVKVITAYPQAPLPSQIFYICKYAIRKLGRMYAANPRF